MNTSRHVTYFHERLALCVHTIMDMPHFYGHATLLWARLTITATWARHTVIDTPRYYGHVGTPHY